jgi:biopolymer transport protein ExbD
LAERPTQTGASRQAVMSEYIAPATSRARRRRERASIGLNLTAMIDVTFLLLVYFMVATEFKLGEEIYRLDLPERGAASVQVDPFDLDEEPLRIRVESTFADYRLAVEGPYRQPGSFSELHDFLVARRITDTAPGGLFAPDHPIIIEPSATTTWQHTLDVFNAAARARYTNVTLAAPR